MEPIDSKDTRANRRTSYFGGSRKDAVVHNRIRAVLKHTRRYAFQGQSRLAADVGVSRSTISRLLRGMVHPSFSLIFAITEALEQDLGRRIDPRELISVNDTYPTPFVCELVGCRGCLPDEAYDENGSVRSEWLHVRPGRWSNLSPPTFSPPPSTKREQAHFTHVT